MKKIISVLFVISALLLGCTQPQPADNPVKTITKQYSSPKSNLSFEYPAAWSLEYANASYEKTPHLYVYEGNIREMQTVCGELGGCQQDEKKIQQDIENGTAPGIINFKGGKGSLTVYCSGPESWDGIPSPMYELKAHQGDKIYSVILNDFSNRFKASEKGPSLNCLEENYIKKIKAPKKINQAEYKPYDDFVSLIENTLTIK